MNNQEFWDRIVTTCASKFANSDTPPDVSAFLAVEFADHLVKMRSLRISRQSRFDMVVEGTELSVMIDNWTPDQIEALQTVWIGYTNSLQTPTTDAPDTGFIDFTPPEDLDLQPDNLILFNQREDDE